jgi:hypothetical protein
MQSNTLSMCQFSVRAILILLITSAWPLAYGQDQSRYANDTFTVVSRSDHGRVKMEIRGKGDHCWATTSEDNDIGISMGDNMCTASAYDVPDDRAIVARVATNKISFRLNGKSYSISDADTVKSARSLFDPLVSIEAQQSELGRRQRALGEKQRDLGHQQSEVKVQVPDMTAAFQKVEADAKRLSSQGGTPSELGDLQSELGDLQSRIGDLQSLAGDAQSKLGDEQSSLGDQQSRLGDQQSELGEKSGKIAVDIETKLRVKLIEAIKSGVAKPE